MNENPVPSKNRYLILAGLLVLTTGLLAWRISQGPDHAVVVRVFDGDTLKVTYQGQPESLRLIGIDAPENRISRQARLEARQLKRNLGVVILLGQQAKHYVQGLVKPGEVLRLEFDTQRRDARGRLLAYAYLPDGRLLNEVIMQAGYALLWNLPPNARYADRLQQAYRQARAQKTGLWK